MSRPQNKNGHAVQAGGIRPGDMGLSALEVGGLCGVTAATVRRWCDQGTLPFIVTPGGHYRIKRSDVDRMKNGKFRVRRGRRPKGTLVKNSPADRMARGLLKPKSKAIEVPPLVLPV